MDASAHHIHDALQEVFLLRQQRAANPAFAQACLEIKRFQARRFQATYADLLQIPRYQAAATFFLHELYGDQDYAERDQQFSRIATTITKLFPQSVVNTAAALAQVHALTERLDDLMAHLWLSALGSGDDCARYIYCWRRAADRDTRQEQLVVVLRLGQELNRLTRKPGLRTLLKMMRGPAAGAGLSSLQHFLETGFDAFATMKGADEFLQTIQQREGLWIDRLFNDETVACETKLRLLLADNLGA